MSDAPFPHCNAEVLHAPGECIYCDMYPDRQQMRIAGKTPFSPLESNGWRGNIAWTSEMASDEAKFWADLSAQFEPPPRKRLTDLISFVKSIFFG